ncbi:MAG: Grx4 family monothiol glutaredoxin [Simkaniaceae bacterium]
MQTKEEIFKLIEEDLKKHRIVLFMKGSKEIPMCGFSARVVEILKYLQADFVARNVLESDILRSAIKEYSDWPTIPQLYIEGEFIGGCDITEELFENGELEKMIQKESASTDKS